MTGRINPYGVAPDPLKVWMGFSNGLDLLPVALNV